MGHIGWFDVNPIDILQRGGDAGDKDESAKDLYIAYGFTFTNVDD